MYLLSNDLTITNVILVGQNTTSHYTMVKFDITWTNSWRNMINYDAAWIFVKYSLDSGATWHQTWLNTTAGNHVAPSGSAITVGTTTISSTPRGIGCFLYPGCRPECTPDVS